MYYELRYTIPRANRRSMWNKSYFLHGNNNSIKIRVTKNALDLYVCYAFLITLILLRTKSLLLEQENRNRYEVCTHVKLANNLIIDAFVYLCNFNTLWIDVTEERIYMCYIFNWNNNFHYEMGYTLIVNKHNFNITLIHENI